MPQPVEPPPSRWGFPSPAALAELPDPFDGADEDYEPDQADDLIAVGADLEPGTVLAAYRSGLFPMPQGRRTIGWWSPARRGVLPLDRLRVSRSLRRSIRDFEIRYDTDFDAVIDGCADPSRDHSWIDGRIKRAYGELHRLGWAHSVEAWQDGRLVGGLYGIEIGGLFAGESMFHRVRDASKVALVGLVDLLASDEHGAAGRRLIDVQWSTPHLATLGVVERTRASYVTSLPGLLAVPPVNWSVVHPHLRKSGESNA